MSQAWDFEARLREALAPVDPPADLEPRLESALGSLVELAADELEAWELRAMRDPRNWLRPAAAVVIGTGAAAGLVLLRTRGRSHKRRALARNPLDLAQRTLRDVGREALRVFHDVAR
jgi:hypothetical protein